MVVDGIFMAGGHGVRRVGPCSAGTMHGAGHDRSRDPAQCRDPRPEKGDEQVDGEKSAHHRHQSIARDSRRNTCEKTRHEENKESKTQLDGCRAPEMH